MTPLVDLPQSRAEIERIQSARKKRALAQARRAPFFRGKLDHVNAERLDDPDEWRKIPLLDKDTLRKLDDRQFYKDFCLPSDDGIAEYWRSGGSTGTPLFYPRSFADIEAAMVGFARTYDCTGCRRGGRTHVSFPLGIHPVGQMLARAAGRRGIAVNWAGSGATTPSVLQLELIERLEPTIWMGMSSYGLHLANLAEARGLDLAARSVETLICSAEPLSDAKRDKLARQWGAQVRDTFGMTEAGMMGAEDAAGRGFRIWTDMFLIEVLDPDSHAPVAEGAVGALVVRRSGPTGSRLFCAGVRAISSPFSAARMARARSRSSRCSSMRTAPQASSRSAASTLITPTSRILSSAMSTSAISRPSSSPSVIWKFCWCRSSCAAVSTRPPPPNA
jgi:phenylacetate-CoA ligase